MPRISAALLIALLPLTVPAQDGSLDLSFGTGGIVLDSVLASSEAFAVAVQPDGRIVVVGSGALAGANHFDILTVRYLQDGSRDTTFNHTGVVQTAFTLLPISFDHGRAVAIQSDGKILTGGTVGFGLDYNLAVLRHNPDGTPDSTFNGTGVVFISPGENDALQAMVLQPDGKILLAGLKSPNWDFAVVRLNTDGSLDPTFDTDGIVTTDFGGTINELATSIMLQPDGKILVAGYSPDAQSDSNYALARYNSDGSLDTTFDGDGKQKFDLSIVDDDRAYGVALTPAGDIVVSGSASTEGSIASLQFHTDGSLDTQFANAGELWTTFGSNAQGGRAVFVQGDGKIVVGGYSNNVPGASNDFTLVRYDALGNLDLLFDTDGIVKTDFAGASDEARALALQPDGKIIAAGKSGSGASTKVALARYNNDLNVGTTGSIASPAALRIAPNPASDHVRLNTTITGSARVEILDACGRLIRSMNTPNANGLVIPVENLQPGSYVLRCGAGDSARTAAFIIAR